MLRKVFLLAYSCGGIDEETVENTIRMEGIDAQEKVLYVRGGLTEAVMGVEERVARQLYKRVQFVRDTERKDGYTFAASGLMELIAGLQSAEQCHCLVSTFAYSGHSACVHFKPGSFGQ